MWLLLSLVTALFTALSAITTKIAVKHLPRVFLLLVNPLMISLFLFSTPQGQIQNPRFFLYLVISGGLSFTASYLQLWAYQKGEISQLYPLVNLTPLFMFITGPLILGEYPTWGSFAGVLLIISGAFLLNMEQGEGSFFLQVKRIFSHRPTLAMMLVAFLWSINGLVDKLGIQVSSPSLWGGSIKALVAFFSLFFLFRDAPKGQPRSWKPKHLLFLLITSLSGVVILLSSFKAYTLTHVVNVIAVKRLSVLIIIIVGQFFLKEKNGLRRFGGGTLMVIGVGVTSYYATG